MSLINKMLQDLDARGGPREEGLQQQELKAVPAPERDRRLLFVAGSALAAGVLAAGGWYGWQAWRTQAAPQGAAPLMATAPAPARAPVTAPVQDAPAPSLAPMPAPELAAAAQASAPSAPQPAPAVPSAPVPPTQPIQPTQPVAATAAPSMPATPPAKAASKPAHTVASAAKPVPAAPAASAARQELTPQQQSENTYRRALTALQDGRVSVALTDLDRALEIDPRNEPARQTYVALLLENRRPEDAIRQLRLALGIDPRQPGLAMVLARLQLERGGPALQTLMTTLPYAAGNADYQAFLAGVLQREQRHAEAAQHYQAALKLSPLNGVWWMGLGISLQADGQLAPAREAYTRARTGNGITPELLAFIDRRIEQLAR
ncbi:MAG: tetratricopeptide repeat protein [Duganella sp.]